MITNKHGIGLSVALMLVNDEYDYDGRPNAISATGLLKPLRILALTNLHKDKLLGEIDVTQLVASVTGSAVHTALENVWLNPKKVKAGLARLGYKNAKVLVNPSKNQIDANPNHSIVWVEQRSEKSITIDDFELILTGKYDIVLEGKLEDLKNTGSFKVVKTLKEGSLFNSLQATMATVEPIQVMGRMADECPAIFEYCMQGSIYKMLNPYTITEDFMSIQFVMKDWMKGKVGQDYYPDVNPYQFDITLFKPHEVLAWVTAKITDLNDVIKTGHIPLCSDSELWRNPPEFKVYKDNTSKRALPKGTFTNLADAQDFSSARKIPGDVRVIPSVPRRCAYCNVREVCTQHDQFIADGLLKQEE